MHKQTRTTKGLMIICLIALIATLFAACGGGGTLSGYYAPEDESAAMASFSSFDFSGSKVTVGLAGGTQSYKVKYTYEAGTDGSPGTLSFEMAGSAVDVPIEVADNGKTIIVGAVKYIKK
jgi:hypothetical protein